MIDEDPVARAVAHASLGLPLPRRTRLRTLKRVLGLLHRSTTRHQTAYNLAVIDALRPVQTQLEAHAIDRANQNLALRSEIATLVERLTTLESLAAVASAGIELEAASLADLANDLHRMRDRVASIEAEQHAARQRELTRRAVQRLRTDSGSVGDGDAATLAPPSEDLLFALEEAFRGSFDEIRDRLRAHLDIVRAASVVGPVIDLGCGRGEWLTILAEAGIEGYGIDQNSLAIEHARARGLNVFEQELFEHLAKCPDGSFGAVTAFHVVEHLKPEALLRLLEQTVRILRPGGVLVVETPNIANVHVGASTFHLDPTHITALHPRLLEFLFSAHGFADVEVRFLQPADPLAQPPAASPELSQAFEVLNQLLFGAQDVAIAGWRRDD